VSKIAGLYKELSTMPVKAMPVKARSKDAKRIEGREGREEVEEGVSEQSRCRVWDFEPDRIDARQQTYV
jgi:hypothetical protein